MEAFCYAVGGDFDRVGVFGLESAIFEGGLKKVDDGQGEAFAGVGSSLRREELLVKARAGSRVGISYHFGWCVI